MLKNGTKGRLPQWNNTKRLILKKKKDYRMMMFSKATLIQQVICDYLHDKGSLSTCFLEMCYIRPDNKLFVLFFLKLISSASQEPSWRRIYQLLFQFLTRIIQKRKVLEVMYHFCGPHIPPVLDIVWLWISGPDPIACVWQLPQIHLWGCMLTSLASTMKFDSFSHLFFQAEDLSLSLPCFQAHLPTLFQHFTF